MLEEYIQLIDINTILRLVLSLYIIKCLILGSDFSFLYFFKFKKDYFTWYKNRETYLEYRDKNK